MFSLFSFFAGKEDEADFFGVEVLPGRIPRAVSLKELSFR